MAHLHSCPVEVLERGDVIRALEDCRQAGKLRAAAYSGDNEALGFALACGRFDAVQTSVSVCDQVNLAERLPAAQRAGLGVIAKRPVAGAVWRRASRPEDHAEGHYWDRWQAMGLAEGDQGDVDWTGVALRFAVFAPGVSSAIIGTSNVEHLKANIAAVARGPLDEGMGGRIRGAFKAGWDGMI